RLCICPAIHVSAAEVVEQWCQSVRDLRIGAGFGDCGPPLCPRQHAFAIWRGEGSHVGGVGGQVLLAGLLRDLECGLEQWERASAVAARAAQAAALQVDPDARDDAATR